MACRLLLNGLTSCDEQQSSLLMVRAGPAAPVPAWLQDLGLPIYASWRSKPRMIITAAMAPELTIDQALAEANSEGFVGEIKEYTSGHTEPHQHDYDVRLFVLEGEIRLTDVQDNVVYACGPGTEAYVSAGTAHTEDHDTLKMIVARRHS